MSETSCVVTFAINGFLDERAYCESYCDLRIQALQRGQSVSVYLFPCRFRCFFLANFYIVMSPRARVFRYVFGLCYGYFSFNL